jgi:hypothetical protein
VRERVHNVPTEANKRREDIMTNLTASQIKTVKSLIRLGDSKELAIKTVLNQKEFDDSVYRLAYES